MTPQEFAARTGEALGTSEWLTIDQEMIDKFAEATGDKQFIHVNPDMAKMTPFGGTIAHGFLTLSLLIPMWVELLDIDGVGTKVNYGLDKVRFVSPVKVGDKIRMSAAVVELEEVRGGYQMVIDATIEVEGSEKPAVVARSLQRFYA